MHALTWTFQKAWGEDRFVNVLVSSRDIHGRVGTALAFQLT